MRIFLLVLISVGTFSICHASTIEEVFESNVGTRIGTQDKDGHSCRFDVSTFGNGEYRLTITFQNPLRARSVSYPAGAKHFSFDLTLGQIVFDKSGLVYYFGPDSLQMISVEEEDLDHCRF